MGDDAPIECEHLRQRLAEAGERIAQLERQLAEQSTAFESNQQTLDFEHRQLIALFEGIDDVMYISDPESYELVYVNSAFRQGWGEDVIGKQCYRVLQNRDTPCPFCSNAIIFGSRLGQTYIWEFQNEITGRWYRCADKALRWADGRLLRFEIAVDISERKQMEKELARRVGELERFNQMAVDREKRMIELKRIINGLSKELGREQPYDVSFAG